MRAESIFLSASCSLSYSFYAPFKEAGQKQFGLLSGTAGPKRGKKPVGFEVRGSNRAGAVGENQSWPRAGKGAQLARLDTFEMMELRLHQLTIPSGDRERE